MKIKRSELWDLDCTLAEFILHRLIAFRKLKRTGHPMSFKNLKDWNKSLDRMIYAMKKVQEGGYMNDGKVNEGLLDFGRHFQALWD